MKKTGILTLFVFIASMFFAAVTIGAQREGMQTEQKKTQASQQQGERELYSATWLIGNKVLNPMGQDLGEVTDIVMDQKTGKAAYVIVSYGGILNFGEERSMVPYNALNIKGDQLILNVDKQKLAEAPKMQRDVTVQEFDRRSAEFFGVSPFFQ